MARSPARGAARLRSVPPNLVVSHAKPDVDEAGEQPGAAEEDVPVGPSPVDTLSEMMAGLVGANNSRISIYRIVKNQPPSYVAECDPASFSLDDLRDRHGGGEFRLYIMKDGRIWKNMRVFVDPPVRDPNAAVTAPASHMGDVLAVMRDGFAAQAAAMRELATRPVGQSPLANLDLPAVITAISGAIVALRPPPAPIPPAADASKAIDMFMQGLQMARELREDAAPADNSIGGMLRSFLTSPVVAQAVAAAAPAPRPAGPPALPRPQGAVPQQPAPQPSQPQPAQPTMPTADVMTQYYALLCQKAASGADPTLYAELILDSVDDDTLNMLLSKQPTPLDALIAEYPPAAPHRDWFASLIGTLMEAMTDEVVPGESAPEGAETPTVNGAHADATLAPSPIVPGQSA